MGYKRGADKSLPLAQQVNVHQCRIPGVAWARHGSSRNPCAKWLEVHYTVLYTDICEMSDLTEQSLYCTTRHVITNPSRKEEALQCTESDSFCQRLPTRAFGVAQTRCCSAVPKIAFGLDRSRVICVIIR
jgi:hypothetical protein